MKTTSIVFAAPSDINAAAVSWAFARSGLHLAWAKSAGYHDTVLRASSLRVGTAGLSLQGAFSEPALKSVWYRRARESQDFDGARACDLNFLREQWRFFRQNLDQLAPHLGSALWVNSPLLARAGENKAYQLHQAHEAGFSVPDTLISNDPEQISAFVAQYDQVIFKTFTPHLWLDQTNTRASIAHARLLDRSAEIDPRSLAICPGIFQRYVAKQADLRVTVIGDQQFAMQLHSRAGDEYVDWRSHAHEANFLAQATEIDGATAGSIRRLMHSMGLNYGCVDLVRDHAGALHFLEVNQSGQFLFAERWVPELPLLRAMTAMLATGRTDYALDAVAPIGYREYLQSSCYQQWKAQISALPEETFAGQTVEA